MTSSMKRYAALAFAGIVIAALPAGLAAQVRLPAVIGDHMVVQQDKPVAVWGWAAKGEPVTVLFNGQEKKAVAGEDGKWRVAFDPVKAGGPALEMTVRGAKGPALIVKDILVGEVWLCSGQSNMEMSMSWLPYPSPDALRADNPNMRLFFVPKRTADRPQDDVAAKWEPSTPEAVRTFSAVAYYFGLELHRRLGVPVGLIDSAWGGTDIEPWTPPIGFASVARRQAPARKAGREVRANTGTRWPRPCRRGGLDQGQPQGPGRQGRSCPSRPRPASRPIPTTIRRRRRRSTTA